MNKTYLLGTLVLLGSAGAVFGFGCSGDNGNGGGSDGGGIDSSTSSGSSSGGSSSGSSSGKSSSSGSSSGGKSSSGSSSGSGSSSSSSSSGGSSSSGSSSGSSGGMDAGPDAPTLSCDTYCATILTNCGAADGGVGGNAQYYDTADCKNTCALFAMGTYGDSMNSLGCRQYHATLAASDPTIHCPHAGAGGGGLCGMRCDDYCSLAMAHCTVANGADPPFASLSDCMAACNAYPYQTDASDYDPDLISTLNCLDYHLRESFSDLPGQGIDGGHCDDQSIDGGTVRGACHP